MKKNKYLNIRLDKFFVFFFSLTLLVSCGDLDQDFEGERFLTASHFNAISETGGIVGIQSIDGAILSFLRDGGDDTDEFGLKAVDLGMDLRSNDMDMSASTWFGDFNDYENIDETYGDNEFLWAFFYKVIKDSNEVISLIPETVTNEELLVYKNKAYFYRGMAYFYLLRIYQHTKASDATLAIPLDLGELEPQPKATVGDVKKQVEDDLLLAYNGLKEYSRASVEEVDSNVAAAFLARYYLTYENWADAEKYGDIAMSYGSISSDVTHGFDELSLSETLWGAQVTATTSEVYASYFSHMSQINDGYSGWNHFKTVNSNLYDMIPSTDKRQAWFADQDYGPWVILVPGTWEHYNETPKYTSLKFHSAGGWGVFTGDYIYLRNTEFYLTKAEALARQNKNAQAQQVLFDLNSIRDESYVLSSNTGQDLIDEILMYRRIEMWGDGIASFDMARNGVGLNRKDGRLNLVQPGADLVIPALDDKMIYKIPISEIDSNPKID